MLGRDPRHAADGWSREGAVAARPAGFKTRLGPRRREDGGGFARLLSRRALEGCDGPGPSPRARRAVAPRPIGFPGCRLCPYLSLRRPDVCLACFEASAGQVTPSRLRRCSSCEQVQPSGQRCPTGWCQRRDRGWSVVFGAGVHTGGLRRAIASYKSGGERWWAGVFARVLAGWLDRRAPWLEDFDAIVAMPAYTGPGARRGWDPVGEVVGLLEGLVGSAWMFETDVVRKRAETRPMSGATRQERLTIASQEVRPALEVRQPSRVAGARLLVIDDVLAEGSTLREVALVLRRAGAAEVAGLVLARPDWRGPDRSKGGPGPFRRAPPPAPSL
jgi:predicted amidophosphoribosyltransferase